MKTFRSALARLTARHRGRPAPPPGWHIDPENPARSVHEPRSGTGSTSVIFTVGVPLPDGGGGGGSSSKVPDLRGVPLGVLPAPGGDEGPTFGSSI